MKEIGSAKDQSLVAEFDTEDEFKSTVDKKARDWSADHCCVKWRGPGRYILACSLIDSEYAEWHVPFDDKSTFVLTSAKV